MKNLNKNSFNITKTFKFLIYTLLITTSYIFLTSYQIYKDYKNSKNNNIQICRFNNIIHGNGYMITGNAILPDGYTHYLGNHIWIETKDTNIRIDYTCPDCPIIERKAKLEIHNGYVKPNFNSFDNSMASLYYINFAALKYYGIIN